jgi:hypothetical protein
MKRMLIYVYGSTGRPLVLRETETFDIRAWFASREWAFRVLGITHVEYEVI